MYSRNVNARNRYVAPLSSKLEDELLLHIRKGKSDAQECRAELIVRGWTNERISRYL